MSERAQGMRHDGGPANPTVLFYPLAGASVSVLLGSVGSVGSAANRTLRPPPGFVDAVLLREAEVMSKLSEASALSAARAW